MPQKRRRIAAAGKKDGSCLAANSMRPAVLLRNRSGREEERDEII